MGADGEEAELSAEVYRAVMLVLEEEELETAEPGAAGKDLLAEDAVGEEAATPCDDSWTLGEDMEGIVGAARDGGSDL